MIIGVGVEGKSDEMFWDKVLHKHFPEHKFLLVNKKTCEKLVKSIPNLMGLFRAQKCDAMFVIMDADKAACPAEVKSIIYERIRSYVKDKQENLLQEIQKEWKDRFVHLICSVQELESWYLADHEAICNLIPGADFLSGQDTSRYNKSTLNELMKNNLQKSYKETVFAAPMAAKFSPDRATACSSSFRFFWGRLGDIVNRN